MICLVCSCCFVFCFGLVWVWVKLVLVWCCKDLILLVCGWCCSVMVVWLFRVWRIMCIWLLGIDIGWLDFSTMVLISCFLWSRGIVVIELLVMSVWIWVKVVRSLVGSWVVFEFIGEWLVWWLLSMMKCLFFRVSNYVWGYFVWCRMVLRIVLIMLGRLFWWVSLWVICKILCSFWSWELVLGMIDGVMKFGRCFRWWWVFLMSDVCSERLRKVLCVLFLSFVYWWFSLLIVCFRVLCVVSCLLVVSSMWVWIK